MTGWYSKKFDKVVARYNHTLETSPESLLPSGNATLADKAFHYLLQHPLAMMSGYQYSWGPEPSAMDLIVSPRELLERATENLHNTDVVAIFPHFQDQLVPQLKFHIPWTPANASVYFEPTSSHARMIHARPAQYPKSTMNNQTLALMRKWLREEFVFFERARRVAEQRTQAASNCQDE
jgi:hypothetical protein